MIQLRTLKKDLMINALSISIICWFLFNIDYTTIDGILLTTFSVNGVLSLYFAMSSKKNITIRRVFYIFIFIFFVMAPLQQKSNDIVFWRGWGLSVEYTDMDYLITNLYITVSILMFEIGYKLKQTFNISIPCMSIEIFTNDEKKPSMLTLVLLTFLSIISFVYLFLNGILFTNYIEARASSNFIAQINGIVKYIPVGCLLFYVSTMQNIKSKKFNILFLVIQLLIVFIIYFPLGGSSARFVLFSTYLSLYTVVASKNKGRALYPFIYIFGFLFIFSLFNVFKFSRDLADVTLSIQPNLIRVDFDAYQMFMATMKYTNDYGICWGQNFLSAFLCFLPRDFFSWRLPPTGPLFMSYYGSDFGNVSCPLIAEMYFAFGGIGIFLLSFILGRIIKKVDSFDYSDNALKRQIFCLYAGISIYIFRGAFLPGWSYSFGFLLSTLLVYFFSKKVSKVAN